MGKRILTGLLSAVLILTSIPTTALQVQANEAVPVFEAEESIVVESENVTDCIEEEYESVSEEVSLEESGEIISTEEIDETKESEEEESTVLQTETDEEESEVEETIIASIEEMLTEVETKTEIDTEDGTETIAEIATVEAVSEMALATLDTDIIASGTYENITWDIDKNGHLTIEGTGEFALPLDSNYITGPRAPWSEEPLNVKVKSAEVNVTGMKDASFLLSYCCYLEEVDFSNFDTSSVVDMTGMFCSSGLKRLDLRGLDTSATTDMSYMFMSCWRLESLNMSKIDTRKVTTMSGMFDGCYSLTDLNLSGVDTSAVTDMSYMFDSCSAISNLDVSEFDTGNVTDMTNMFVCCSAISSLDVSGFNTENVINMSYMFSDLELEELDISNFDTENVTYMSGMFYASKKLKKLDVSNFDTSNVKSMSNMFSDCSNLTELDLSNFDTSNVKDMCYMFSNCSNLTELDLSNFDTSNVYDMHEMFRDCYSLMKLNLSSFDTRDVFSMEGMFLGCKSLTTLNLSNFDLSALTIEEYAEDVFTSCPKLTTIYAPMNLSVSIILPKAKSSDVWYKADGSKIMEFPQGLGYSTLIAKNKVPTIPAPYITVTKVKTAYDCGNTINTDDITVTHYDSMCTVTKVTEGFSTNVAQIDMTTPGKKELVVTYQGLTAKVELTVTAVLVQDEVEITLPKSEYTYNGYAQQPHPSSVITVSGATLTQGVDYMVSYEKNVNVTTEAKVIITGQNNYRGTLEKTFTITPATLTITAKDKLCVFGDELPTNEDFSHRISGLCGTDKLVTEPSFTCPVTDMNVVGTYPITPYGADAGANYIIDYVDGTLTVQEEGMVYSVIFDTMGHGEEVAAITGVKAGSLIMEPEKPAEDGWVFGGWYKDKACTKEWNFETDTVQGDMTLYACWISAVKEGEYKLSVQEIKDQSYMGSAIKPAVRVYAADGSTLLKLGKDYTIKYCNNTAADTAEEKGMGGVNTTGKEGEGGFTRNIPYVVITGKGDYTGSIYRNFHITPASIGDGRDAAKGIALKYSDQLAVNAKKDQKPMSSLKYKKSMKSGRDYIVTITALDAKDGNGNALTEGQTVDAGRSPVIPKGYNGCFLMLVEGIGNYTGSIEKVIYVSNKNNLIKNAAITLGKNLKKMPYNAGEEITLTPGWYDTKAKKYYKVNADGSLYEEAEKNANDIFTVKSGSTYLRYGTDYVVSYENNSAVGNAVMTVTGIGDYAGNKTSKFTITGQAFSTKNVIVGSEFKTSVMYTGVPQTQNKVTLTTKTGEKLIYGVHYTVSYTNNLKKGTATMKFTAKPESGYAGSFTKKFSIKTPTLLESVNLLTVSGTDSIEIVENKIILKADIPYSRNGSTPADRIQLVNKTTAVVLKAGSDYTVSYANNKAVTTESIADNKLPVMTLKGKGNYTGSIKIEFNISEASFEENKNVSIAASSVIFNAAKKDNYQYKPAIKVVDNKKPLSFNKDYKLEYVNCMQPQVKAYLAALADGNKTTEELQDMRPKAVITVIEGKGYEKGQSRTIDLPIYQVKLTRSNLYVVISEESTTYTGAQITPAVEVYYGDSKAITAAKKAMETDASVLTDAKGIYKLARLTVADDYNISYGANIKAGKNKGTVTVTGNNLYGGRVTTKFTIKSRNVY